MVDLPKLSISIISLASSSAIVLCSFMCPEIQPNSSILGEWFLRFQVKGSFLVLPFEQGIGHSNIIRAGALISSFISLEKLMPLKFPETKLKKSIIESLSAT